MSDQATLQLLLPYLMPSQAQKHVTHNEALRLLDGIVQLSVADRDLAAPPAAPEEGARYIVAPGAGGAWAGWDRDVALFAGGGWVRLPVRTGWRAYLEDEGELVVFDGSAWTGISASATQNLARLGVGTMADAANPFAARLNAALWTALPAAEGGTGDLRCTINKEAAGNTASLVFQSGWSGRAELGLAGSDDFAIKVGDDAGAWREAVRIDRGSAEVGMSRLALKQSGWTSALRLANPGDGGAAALEMQYGAGQAYTLDVRAGQPPIMRNGIGQWMAYFEPGNDVALSYNASVVTRMRGDARYQQTSSSRRFKEKEAPAGPRGLSRLEARSWTWGGALDEDDPRRGQAGYGLVAEDVAGILPEAVRRDADGQVEGLDALALIGALVEELKAVQGRIAALEAGRTRRRDRLKGWLPWRRRPLAP